MCLLPQLTCASTALYQVQPSHTVYSGVLVQKLYLQPGRASVPHCLTGTLIRLSKRGQWAAGACPDQACP